VPAVFGETNQAVGDEMRSTKETIVEFMHDPLDVVTQHVLVPAVLSILSGFRSKKDQCTRPPGR
jgi:hypothetical protein